MEFLIIIIRKPETREKVSNIKENHCRWNMHKIRGRPKENSAFKKLHLFSFNLDRSFIVLLLLYSGWRENGH